jgi:hypothetical protein
MSQKFNFFKWVKITKSFFSKNFTNFYNNLLNLFEKKILNSFKKEFTKFSFFKTVKISKFLQIANINILKKSIMILILLLNFAVNSNKIDIVKKRYYLKLNNVKNSILLKNYYYFRAKKYKGKISLFINFRLCYLKKTPIISKYCKTIKRFSCIYLKNIFRSIYYKNYYPFFVKRIKKF